MGPYPVNGVYHPEVSDSAWVLVAGSATVNNFTVQTEISDVYRNTLTGPIIESTDPGAVLDPSTKRFITTITWDNPLPSIMSSTMYLSRFLENAAYTETTETQFNEGTSTGVTVRATDPPGVPDDGEIILGAGGSGNWCMPQLGVNTLDLPKNGVANAVSTIEGKAFAGTGENASGVSLAVVDITDTNPPVSSIIGTIDGYKTNGVFIESENYGYIATDTNNAELVIVSLSTFQTLGTFDTPGPSDGESVFVLGNTAYITTGNKLYNVNVTNKTSPVALDSDGVILAGTGTSIFVQGNYAYVSISESSTKLQVVDVSNPANLTVVAQAVITAGNATGVYINSTATRAYVATAASTNRELYIINIESKSGNLPIISSYEANGMSPKGVTGVPGNYIILVGSGGEEYQVVNIANETNPVRCGGITTGVSINDVASVAEADGDVYSYILVAQNPEFRIIAGGPGGSYAVEGEFESDTFDPGYTTANNRFMANFSAPPGTSLEFQVSMAEMVGGVCPATGGYTFVGLDGSTSTRSTLVSGQAYTFPFASVENYVNPGRCIRYKAFFSTTDPNNTPVLYDVTINYSP
jgi:hypothetical protein